MTGSFYQFIGIVFVYLLFATAVVLLPKRMKRSISNPMVLISIIAFSFIIGLSLLVFALRN